ncbi:pca operon transcription factor PcaQ [Devosia sp. YIM 151766]|uniref:pca operon transcription factor PcaQ n=1 Tax=Devosia sp. YIM 151766 TaxID=3017325 RepID=UPI00255C8DA7|nr:pca operon transcription factor PcaQ [Devosia sp. YIM 151766]WIY54573.1 pca operon transcription factor PcaQ [Devosia sp. YIM 151766]
MIDPRIKIRHIACFLEVARLRSMVNAADALNISQPAATKTVQELEAVLGGALFDRTRRRLALTPFGEVFYRYASTSIAALRQGIDAARGAREAALVRIGALPSVSARMLPEAVRLFFAAEPGINSRIITGPNSYLLSLLRTGDVDLVIGRMAEPEAMLGLSFEHLYSERVVLVVRPGHPLLARRDFSLGMIEPYQRLMPNPGSVIRPLVQRILLAYGIDAQHEEVETVSNAFGRAYVRQSDAVWFISEGVVADDVADNYLALLPVDMSETQGPVGFTTRTDTAPGLALTAFMQTVRDVAARLRDGD